MPARCWPETRGQSFYTTPQTRGMRTTACRLQTTQTGDNVNSTHITSLPVPVDFMTIKPDFKYDCESFFEKVDSKKGCSDESRYNCLTELRDRNMAGFEERERFIKINRRDQYQFIEMQYFV